jgi:transcriptional regulator with XRE-family HTH domain
MNSSDQQTVTQGKNMNMPSEDAEAGDLLNLLRATLTQYFESHRNMSLNGLAKRCSVSEPTLRRIFKGQVKTLPNSSTILEILSAVSGERNTSKLAERYSGPIGDYLRLLQPQIEDCEPEIDPMLNSEFKDPVKYIIYKLAANSTGVTERKVSELFGARGITCAEELLRKEYLKKNGQIYYSQVRNFASSGLSFIDNFKVLAEFVKSKFSIQRPDLNPLVANYSESVTPKAYQQIVKIQRKSLAKIRKIMSAPESQGTIPLFILLAVDTLDHKPAHEIADSAV